MRIILVANLTQKGEFGEGLKSRQQYFEIHFDFKAK